VTTIATCTASRPRAAVPRALAVACATVLALAGCTADDAPDPAPTGTAPSSSAPAPSPDPAELARRAALDGYVAAERATIPALLEQVPGTYASVVIDPVYPAGVSYTYRYAEQVDPAAAAPSFEVLDQTLRGVCRDTLFPALAAAGVTGARSAAYMYVNADGTTLWTQTYTSG